MYTVCESTFVKVVCTHSARKIEVTFLAASDHNTPTILALSLATSAALSVEYIMENDEDREELFPQMAREKS